MNKTFYFTGKFFGLRGGREHRTLEWGRDIQLTQTEEGEALVYTNQFSKNYNGGLKQRNQGIKPKVVKAFGCPDRPDRCFVKFYKLYASKRPIDQTSYYLKALTNYNDRWFSVSPIGHNTLSKMMNDIANAGFLDGNFTNHSLKKTTGNIWNM